MLPTGEQASIFTGGIIISVRAADGSDLIDIEADNALIWSRGGLTQQMIDNMRRTEGQTSRDLEFYFSGNVQIRQKAVDGTRLLQASEVYLDASRNVAIALDANLELTRKGVPQPVHVRAGELRQLSNTRFEAVQAEIFSSKLPSDPGVRVLLSDAVIDELRVPKTTLFGTPIVNRQGEPIMELERPITGRNARIVLEEVPIFYVPYFKGDAADPFGPLQSIRLGGNRIFGFVGGVTLDGYDLFHLQRPPDSRWRLDIDYLSKRGPALGTNFDSISPTFFEIPAKVTTTIRGFGIYDTGTDILGGNRGPNDDHPDWRGRFLFRQGVQELPEGFVVQTQIAPLSDRNFLEQYFKNEFDNDLNQSTYLYLRQSQGNYEWSAQVEPRIRNWVTETELLPRADGHALGLSFFDRFTYNADVSAGYLRLLPSSDPLAPVSPTDVASNAGRFDLFQELSLPFYVGPFKLAPYVAGDLTYYTSTINNDGNDGRLYGGAGLRASLPLTRLYPDVHSLLWNLDGIMHKVVFTTNAYIAGSSASHYDYAQFDRLNDDATDQALRDIKPQQINFNPGNAFFLTTSPLYDPQVYAIRRLIEDKIDTVDNMEVVQLDLRQRLQTKRGFPGQEHIIDWMTLDLSASIFPAANRDNFGSRFGFLEYDYNWNIGDRTALVSTGWVDPEEHGPRVFTVGTFLDRPDRTSFYIGYRQIDPLLSKAVTGAFTYVFSPKYAMTASSTYDFGTNQSLANSVVFTRMGADLNVGVGVTYNALQNNFGVLVEVLPSLLQGHARALGKASGAANTLLGGRE
jgi:hypothetical protein